MQIRLILGFLLLLGASSTVQAADYKVYYMGGQSNMEGFGFVSELSGEWSGPVENVMIFNGRITEDGQKGGGVGIWAPLQPGHGMGFSTDGKVNVLSERFGPELAFGKHLASLDPEYGVAIIKYSKGGTALLEGGSGYGNWEPDSELGAGINQYDHALASIRHALSHRDIDGDGEEDSLIPAGIVWMQGEADAYEDPVAARAYRHNLKRMMDLLRAALRYDDLPLVLGRIIDSGRDEDGFLMDYSPVVQAAQEDFVAADHCASLVDISEGIQWSDDWHYDTASYLRLGKAFAEAMQALSKNCP